MRSPSLAQALHSGLTAGVAGSGLTIFVMPVDDLDLNPPSCLLLLRLLRLISSRRLFMVILGDERLAELVVNLQLSNDLASLVRDTHSGDDS